MAKKEEKCEIIYIEWYDSSFESPIHGWLDENAIEHLNIWKAKSVGIIVKEDKESVTITQGLVAEKPRKYDYVTIIPKCSIKKIKRFKV